MHTFLDGIQELIDVLLFDRNDMEVREIRTLIHSIEDSMKDKQWNKWIPLFKASILVQKANHLTEIAETVTAESI